MGNGPTLAFECPLGQASGFWRGLTGREYGLVWAPAVANKVKLRGKATSEVPLKVMVPLSRKRQMLMASGAAKGPDGKPMDLSTWVRTVLFRELDDPRPK